MHIVLRQGTLQLQISIERTIPIFTSTWISSIGFFSFLQLLVSQTLDFVEKYWWNGHGWWGTVDVNGEDAYYGRMNRPSAKLPTPCDPPILES